MRFWAQGPQEYIDSYKSDVQLLELSGLTYIS
jgi:hypothetical protein